MTSKSPNSSPSSLAKRHIAVSPSAIHKRPDLSRSNSTVRKAVDNEIQAVAELMSPCVEGRQDQLAEEQEATGTPIDDSTDSEVDTLLPDELEHKRAIRVSFSSSMKSGILSNRRSSFVASSVYSVGSDHGEWQADTGGERSNCESPSSDYRSYQLPRVYTSDSDAPSLTTRASSSSINSSMPPTPNRLSVSSLLLPISPPVSPSALKPVEPVQLAVIPERNLEDDESQYGISIEYIQGSASFPTASPLHRGDVLSPTPPSNVSAESVDTVRPRRLPAKPGQLILPAVADCGVSRWDRSPTPSSSSGSGTASPRSAAFGARMGVGAAAFSRFLSKGDRDQARHQASSPIMDDSISDKAWKAEEKKRKKQEAKERTERLALELKMRTAERKAAQEAQPTSPKAPKDAVMYGGMVWS
ncbi:hypothetical protein JAAARDRAFT_30443 [Jaapia argillacea MUCL 33604]|uniref:Uncharacterized protein n=1 Tax=Jaapia argillacea MUCL 33604 TaxID=933084 RepID=A0A067QGA2_9AGAM|nr:hypothetical protein JAAARDRAFT_30443 [Jaapia argillacea MUCL 33604]